MNESFTEIDRISDNEDDDCNKYKIYELQQFIEKGIKGRYEKVYKTTTHFFVEPVFFFGKWFRPVEQTNRRERSLMYKEATNLYGLDDNPDEAYLTIQTIITPPTGNFFNAVWEPYGGVEIFTEIGSTAHQGGRIKSTTLIRESPRCSIPHAILPPHSKRFLKNSSSVNTYRYPIGHFRLSYDSENSICFAKYENFLKVPKNDPSFEDKVFDATIFDCNATIPDRWYDNWVVHINDSIINYPKFSSLTILRHTGSFYSLWYHWFHFTPRRPTPQIPPTPPTPSPQATDYSG